MLYDEESDTLRHITFAEALRASCLGKSATLTAQELFGGSFATLRAWLENSDIIRSYFAETDAGNANYADLVTVMNIGDAGAVNTAWTTASETIVNGLINAVEAGWWLPICITIARPFIEHLAMSAVVVVSGRDTGATLFGPADMQISANTSVKTIEGHYTCHTKSVITKPQNVYVMRDVMLSGYVAGGNTQFFGMSPENRLSVAEPRQVANDLAERLSHSDETGKAYKSMFAFVHDWTAEANNNHRDQVISVSERVLPWEVSHTTQMHKESFPGGNKVFEAYKNAIALSSIHFGEDIRASENMSFLSMGSTNNALCFLGPHRKYAPFGNGVRGGELNSQPVGTFELVPGQGHFGADAVPGDARWRRGEAVSLKSARESMSSYHGFSKMPI
jgi:hypothetical protein